MGALWGHWHVALARVARSAERLHIIFGVLPPRKLRDDVVYSQVANRSTIAALETVPAVDCLSNLGVDPPIPRQSERFSAVTMPDLLHSFGCELPFFPIRRFEMLANVDEKPNAN